MRGVGPALVTSLLLAACGETGMPAPDLDPAVVQARGQITQIPEQYQQGNALYQQDCARCHGEDGLGTLSGPPLLHRVYQPTHHSDAAFLLAVRAGVRAHHWNFGDMEALPGVSAEDVGAITSYVRWLQQETGVY
jgi:mono/diheme cytochrome c family protein